MNKTEAQDRFSEVWKQSRIDAGRSQDYMAKALKVSKKTVQNWEAGYSSPSVATALLWFEVIKLQPMPYFLEVLYPDEFKTISAKASDKEIEDALIKYIKGLRPIDKRKLLFVTYGDHGSAFNELVEMLTAHFHTPEYNRITIAQNICTNYEIAEATGNLIASEHVKPDINILKRAIIKKRNRLLGTEDSL